MNSHDESFRVSGGGGGGRGGGGRGGGGRGGGGRAGNPAGNGNSDGAEGVVHVGLSETRRKERDLGEWIREEMERRERKRKREEQGEARRRRRRRGGGA